MSWLGAAVGAIMLALLVGALSPVNQGWQQPAPDSGDSIEIFVETNGVHTGLLLPRRNALADWDALLPVPPTMQTQSHLLFGWGSRDVYLNVPTWGDLTPAIALKAATGSDGIAHVDAIDRPAPAPHRRSVRLTGAQYARLAAFVRATFVTDAAGRAITVGQGYGAEDAFFEATDGYSAANSCNAWTARALRHAGVRVGRWTPLESGVMRWFPAPTPPPTNALGAAGAGAAIGRIPTAG